MTDIDLELNAGPALDDPMQDSLYRRMRTMHSLYYQAVDTMDLEHVNHFEREGVLPIAFSLFHYVNVHDGSFMMITGEPPIWNDEWQERVQLTIADHGKHKTVDEMVAQRIGDYDAYKEYQRAVFERTEAHLAHDGSGRLHPRVDRQAVPADDREHLQRPLRRSAGITVLDGFECWLYQHGLRHMGEIELARGLVGLGGMTS